MKIKRSGMLQRLPFGPSTKIGGVILRCELFSEPRRMAQERMSILSAVALRGSAPRGAFAPQGDGIAISRTLLRPALGGVCKFLQHAAALRPRQIIRQPH